MTKPFHFEAKVESVSKNSKGIFLRLLISEAPPELMTMAVSQRLMVAASPLGDFDEDVGEGDRAVQLAGILCRSKSFWDFVYEKYTGRTTGIRPQSEDEAAIWLRGRLGIDSRSELRHSEKAREQLRLINEKFQTWADRNSL